MSTNNTPAEHTPLDPDTADSVRFSVAAATALGLDALGRIGYTAEQSHIITGHLIDSALCGYSFAGLPRILAIAKSPRTRAPRQPIAIEYETPVSARVNAGNHVGYLAAHEGTRIAIEKSRQYGISTVGVHNSYFSGRGAYYVEQMVQAGLVGIYASSAQPKIIAPGTRQRLLGTNPLCLGFPTANGPLIFDMGTAAIMGGELSLHALLGKTLPEGVAFDEQGEPTRDPNAALRGGVAPFGGHRGYGLALSIQALGLLAGGALTRGRVTDYGFLFLAVRPDVLLPPGEFEQHVAQLVRELKALPRQPGVDEIRVPFERSQRERARRLKEGIVLERSVVDALQAL